MLDRLQALLDADDRRGEAAFTFMSDIMPPPMLDELRASQDRAIFESYAPTLAYDYTVLGNGDVPVAIARAVAMPVLLLVGEESAEYKHIAVEELVKSLPRVELVRKTLGIVPPLCIRATCSNIVPDCR